MKHFVCTTSPGRVGVAYMLPGTNVANVVVDAPRAARRSLAALAAALTHEPAPHVQPADRPIVKGFYGAEQGDLF